ncbi:MAG: FAD-dependent oxidoreductase [Oscillospiraceae bacterium]|nr:FAD-dependent oxidoreductase [Oscillospiraceae bacterium]
MSEMINIKINGVPVQARAGETVLNAAVSAGIEIPNLCYMRSLAPYGACGMCVVETSVSPKLMRACSATVSEGMEINTESERVLKARKLVLELMMGDHDGDCVAPCVLNCPAHTNCQKYLAEIADGDYDTAMETIREKITLPASIGRVCPHPCETACRRQHVEEPISICFLKGFAADSVYKNRLPVPKTEKPTGKSVGIIGGGPAGLTAAYQLAKSGHSVVIYDKMPKAGGMLRYGIPEYRLPKAVLDREIEVVTAMGVEIRTNCEIGKDIDFEQVRKSHDAVLVANGAWQSMALRCPGEDLEGVFGGIDFLREVALGGKPAIGRKTAIVGGGNTAMDACRTAVRLGAEEVSIIYRRTRAEMPAEDIEIEEAEEEGVIFRFLTNPAEILGKDGRVTGVKLQVMKLGEPDERGRRAPVPVEGEFIELPLDSIIIAAGQKNDPAGFDALPKTQKGTVAADEHFFTTSLEGVFAAGDVTNRGAGIAVEAIAEANAAAKAIDAYLLGMELTYKEPVLSRREVENIDFTVYEKRARAVMPQRAAAERRNDFKEINLGFSEDTARAEAARCLKCGCHDYGDCRLIKYADQYDTDCKKFSGDFHTRFTETALRVIERNQNKCILCNLCVRTCENEAKKGILGLVGRGFDTVIKPEFKGIDIETVCRDCLKCADACPTGALKIICDDK